MIDTLIKLDHDAFLFNKSHGYITSLLAGSWFDVKYYYEISYQSDFENTLVNEYLSNKTDRENFRFAYDLENSWFYQSEKEYLKLEKTWFDTYGLSKSENPLIKITFPKAVFDKIIEQYNKDTFKYEK